MRLFVLALLLFPSISAFSQQKTDPAAKKWADSVYKSLNPDQRIAQLIVTRLSSMDVKTKKITSFYNEAAELVKKYNIGGICIFQGSPVLQASQINTLQSIAKTPLFVSIDAEWGLGMRIIDSILPLPKQMMLGAMKDASIVFKYGQVVAAQCKRMGIHMNFAPVIDINNNPDNPVINDRSFGEDKYKVTLFGTQYMKGMQEMGVMACAKHFPGHGDVSVDSHFDLPVINKSMSQLDSLELFPFRQLFKEGIGSVMVAHLFIPSIDNRANRPTSLSGKNINELMRKKIGYSGLTVTDGLEMQGVKKFFPAGESSLQALIAGNDLLLLPENIPAVIGKIKQAIASKKLSWKDIESHCMKVLMAKYQYVLPNLQPIDPNNLASDLNKDVAGMRRMVAENALTLLAGNDSAFFPLDTSLNKKDVAYVAVGINNDNAFAARMRNEYQAGVYFFDFSKKSAPSIDSLLEEIVSNNKKIVIGIHNINRAPASNFGISEQAVTFVNKLQQRSRSVTFLFGNAYAARNWCTAKNFIVCYEDDSIIQQTAIDMLQGKLPFKGTLPVTICDNFQYGSGIVAYPSSLPKSEPSAAGFDVVKLAGIDSVVNDALLKGAFPGCVVLVAKDGKIAFQKAYGSYTYERKEAVRPSSVYDLASLTKILATTLSIMKLYDEGIFNLKKKLGDYLPEAIGTGKENISMEQLLLHEGGLEPFTPLYKETLDNRLTPLSKFYAAYYRDNFTTRVSSKLYLRNDLVDTFYKRILQSPLRTPGKYLYSDNDFIFLGKIVERLTGLPLDEYVKKKFYQPMGLASICFHPLDKLPLNRIVPSEKEPGFRMQELTGDVNDPGAAFMGGMAGHAGLFSDANDVACLMQLLLNGGLYNGKRYLKVETIGLFTSYHRDSSRRGYGFDKPERDNATRKEAYPALSASPKTFGHTGFTGTCAWADPASNLVFVFLSNRVYPTGNNLFLNMNIRPKIFEIIYRSMLY
jgi:beta-glucosidase-like glycosyl hydrolase/CubicO group peptidase (beta-lactamase class C family)